MLVGGAVPLALMTKLNDRYIGGGKG